MCGGVPQHNAYREAGIGAPIKRRPNFPASRTTSASASARRIGRAAALARSLGRKFAVESPATYAASQRVTVERGLEIDLHGFTVAAGALLGP
jgi:hypothetical protein